MSKHWKQPVRKSVAVRPSRIRRDPPARPKTQAELQAEVAAKREQELWGGVTGVVIFALAIAVVAVAIGAVTYSRYHPASAKERFHQCYNGGDDCVLDGDTIYFERQKLDIAGIETPAIQGSQCAIERNRGIDAAVRLAALLNSGEVTIGTPVRDQYGRAVREVQVNGKDVGKAMIAAKVAREYLGEKRDWCAIFAERSDSDE